MLENVNMEKHFLKRENSCFTVAFSDLTLQFRNINIFPPKIKLDYLLTK